MNNERVVEESIDRTADDADDQVRNHDILTNDNYSHVEKRQATFLVIRRICGVYLAEKPSHDHEEETVRQHAWCEQLRELLRTGSYFRLLTNQKQDRFGIQQNRYDWQRPENGEDNA